MSSTKICPHRTILIMKREYRFEGVVSDIENLKFCESTEIGRKQCKEIVAEIEINNMRTVVENILKDIV